LEAIWHEVYCGATTNAMKQLNSPNDVGPARVQRPQRQQVEWRPLALDDCLPSDHRARVVWRYVESLDLSPLYVQIRAVAGSAGRDAVDPRILLALWMFATIEAVSSARQLARLCERDLAYMWLCGGVGVNYHLLSDFRTAHGEFLDDLLTNTIATLLHQKLVTLETVAQDGMRVRAHAGSSSFRRRRTLEAFREEARQQVRRLKEESEQAEDQDASNKRRQSAQERATREREERIEQALAELAQLHKQKEEQKKGSGSEARTSTTDPKARKMKMADGGYRPAYNVQFASDGDARMIVGVEVTNSGSDCRQMPRMQEQLRERYERIPKNYLVDGGFAGHDDVTQVERSGSCVLAPIHSEEKLRREGKDPYARQRRDTDESFAFRQRMATEQAKELYKQRPSIAEFPNAECRNRGLVQFRVRGLAKTKAVALWHAVTFNFMRMLQLGFL
jgi:transposase